MPDNYLIQCDSILAHVISKITLPVLPKPHKPYLQLLHAVVSQQISCSVAEKIWQRIILSFGYHLYPVKLLAVSSSDWQLLGLSPSKIKSIRSIAACAHTGGLKLSTLNLLTDQEVIDQLTLLYGVGTWTAKMVLIFSMHRPDIFLPDDLGLQKAMRALYGIDQHGANLKKTLESIATQWSPYRTLACLYLWSWQEQTKILV